MASNRWVRIAVFNQVMLLAYLEIVEWINLFPWNDIRGGNGQPVLDVVLGLVMIGLISVTVLRWRWGMILAVLLYSFWMVLQIISWWVPYVRGASPGWQAVYARFFAHTTQIFPARGDHLPPDACHTVLQLLLLATIASTLVAALKPTVRRVAPTVAQV